MVITSGKDWTKELIEYLQSFAVAGVLAAVIILFIAQSFVVKGESMEPSLHDGERLLIEKITYRFGDPHRGDIVVLKTNTKEKYIKRVIGVPGDIIEIKNNRTYVNGRVISDDFTLEGTADPIGGTWPTYKVPKGKYFVMGDNRNHSDDSRLSVGYLPKRDIVGRACFRYFPLNKIEVLRRPQI